MKLIHVTICLLLLNNICVSQENDILVDTSKIWSVIYQFQGQGIFKAHTTSYRINEEVVVENTIYFRLFRCNNSFLNDWDLTDTLIREENGKVFIKLPNQSEFKTYDFNLSIGDSIKNKYGVDMNYVVQNIDTVIVEGEERRRWFLGVLEDRIDQIWIEGVGCTSDWLIPGNWEGYAPRFLLCMKDCETLNTLYSSPYFSECYIAYNNTSIKNSNNSECIKIYPNPFKDKLRIETSFPNFHLKIYNPSGQILIRKDCLKTENINLGDLKHGVYLLKINNANNEYNRILIK